MCRALRHRRIESGAALFDRRKVETRRIRNGLKEVGIAGVSVCPGNCRMLPFVQVGDSLREGETGLQVRVVVADAVPGPPTGVHGELHEVRKPQLPAGAGCRTPWQSAKGLQTYGIGSLRYEVCVQEVLMRELIIGVVVDVLGHV